MTGNSAAKSVDVATLRQWLGGDGEIAFLDVREDGQHGAGHPLLAVNAPYSRLELVIGQLAPRRGCPVVLLDDGDGVAEKAARRLAALGYSAVHVLAGGVGAWSAAGHPLFPSTNVPSKAFAEIVEHEYGTPAISAAELERRRRAGDNIVVLDSRPLDEYARFHVPGAMTCPGAELVLRFADLVPDAETTVVVSCAGRTRGIIGAVIAHRGRAEPGAVAGRRHAGLAARRLRPRTWRDNHPQTGQPASARGGEDEGRGGRGAVRHQAYRPSDTRGVACRARAHDLRARRADGRRIRRRPPAGLDLGAGRTARPSDRPLGRGARRAAGAGRRHVGAGGYNGAMAPADGLGCRRARRPV